MSGTATRLTVGAAAVAALMVAVTLGAQLIGADGSRSVAGDPAPDLSFEMFDGSTASMADYEGRPVVVNFWASWCPPCVAEMPDLETVHQEFADEVAFLGINTQDTPDAATDLAERTGVTYDLAHDPDGQLFQAFGGFGMPTTLFVSADGLITERHTGILTLDQAREFVENELSR